jgi:hypothetical protein
MKKIFVLLSASLFLHTAFAVGPWVNPKGSLFTQTSFLFLRYNQVFNGQNAIVNTSNGIVSDFAIRNYTEYSITDRTLITAILPIRYTAYNGSSTIGLADIRLGGKTELFPNNSPLSVYYSAFIPTGVHKGALRTDYKVWSAELGLATGFAVEKYYAQLSGGFRVRDKISNQSIFELEIARLFMIKQKKLYVAFNFDGAINAQSIDNNVLDEFDKTQLYHPNAEYISPGLKFLFNVKNNWWITATAKGGIVAKNIGAAPGLDIGFAYKIEK